MAVGEEFRSRRSFIISLKILAQCLPGKADGSHENPYRREPGRDFCMMNMYVGLCMCLRVYHMSVVGPVCVFAYI
jgi:hypothetical protein